MQTTATARTMSDTLDRLMTWALNRPASGHKGNGTAMEDEMTIPAGVYFERPHNKNLRRIFPDDMVDAIKQADDQAEERYADIEQSVSELRTARNTIIAKKKIARKRTCSRRKRG